MCALRCSMTVGSGLVHESRLARSRSVRNLQALAVSSSRLVFLVLDIDRTFRRVPERISLPQSVARWLPLGLRTHHCFTPCSPTSRPPLTLLKNGLRALGRHTSAAGFPSTNTIPIPPDPSSVDVYRFATPRRKSLQMPMNGGDHQQYKYAFLSTSSPFSGRDLDLAPTTIPVRSDSFSLPSFSSPLYPLQAPFLLYVGSLSPSYLYRLFAWPRSPGSPTLAHTVHSLHSFIP